MTHLVERIAELRLQLDHLRRLRPRVSGPEDLRHDLSLHNDVLFSLLTICQAVIDLAGELCARHGSGSKSGSDDLEAPPLSPSPPSRPAATGAS